MSSIRLLTHIGRQAPACVYKQLSQQNKMLKPNCWNTKEFNILTNKRQYRCLATLNICSPPIITRNFHYPRCISSKSTPDRTGKTETKAAAEITNNDIFAETSKLGLFAKFKLMYKKYWYVLIPVHIVTSVGWFAGFYYLSQSGVDIPSLLHQLHVSETIIEKMKNSSMGHLAIAYLCYKVATPLRYAVTLGGTTVSIKYLVQAGHIKPMPSKEQLMEYYEQKKAEHAAAKDKEK